MAETSFEPKPTFLTAILSRLTFDLGQFGVEPHITTMDKPFSPGSGSGRGRGLIRLT